MALIRCPECGNLISNRSERYPHCGLSASYFFASIRDVNGAEEGNPDYRNLSNVLISFEKNYAALFSLEHYALSESGCNSLFTPQQRNRYLKAISDRRRLHKVNRTTLLETWSFYSDRRPLLDHLKEVLEREGLILKPRNLEEVYKKIVETGKDKYIYKRILFMMKFIEQYKTTGYDKGGSTLVCCSEDA